MAGQEELYDKRFRAPFEESLQLIMRRHAGNTVDEATTLLIRDDLLLVKHAFQDILQDEELRIMRTRITRCMVISGSCAAQRCIGNYPHRTIPLDIAT